MDLFGSLSSKLQKITQKMGGKVRVTEEDIKEMMREIQLALLEADVHFRVVKDLIKDVSEKSKGVEVMKSLTPGQQIVKLVHESLVQMLGQSESRLQVNPKGFTSIMLFGLQGSGKTTSSAKLAKLLKSRGKKVMLVSVDTHRPAAAKQLEVLAKQIEVPCYIEPEEKNALAILERATQRAKYLMCDTLIVDTAGRMTVDAELMQELQSLEQFAKPDEKLLVVDAMIGQESVNIAKAFEESIGLTGFLMTKLDGDARGGAALSIYQMTQKPIKFICLGEKVDAIESFHPARMASRILGMGDVLSLIEKVSRQVDQEHVEKTMERMMQNRFTMEDMLTQMEQVKKMGSLKDLVGMMPGMQGQKIDTSRLDDKMVDRNIAIIRSMTLKERKNVALLNASRRKRIALGSGTQVQDVNRLVKQYEDAAKVMKKLGGMNGLMSKLGKFAGFGGMPTASSNSKEDLSSKLAAVKDMLTKGGSPF